MGHYIANVRDLEFNLLEVLDVARYSAPENTPNSTSTRCGRSCRGRAPGRGPGRRILRRRRPQSAGVRPGPHTISVSAELAKTVQAIKDAEWWRLGLAEGIGGMAAPPPLTWAVNEMISRANPSAGFFNLGPVMANALYVEGNEQQKQWAAEGNGARLGGHHGAHRARRGLRRRRGPRQGHRAARRHLAHRGR